MLTEYSTNEDMRKFRDRAWNKFYEMREGWMKPKIRRLLIDWHRNSESVKRGFYKPFVSKFVIDNQDVHLSIKPFFRIDGVISDELYLPSIITRIETNSGRLYFMFEEDYIHIYPAHYGKRLVERYREDYLLLPRNSKVAYFRRDGELLEYCVYGDVIMIAKRKAHDIVLYKTLLTRDMCNSRHHKELIARAERGVDCNDIYEWK